jgi:hypothetical protein
MTNAVNIKAIIKYCRLEGGNVVYFKSGRRIFKMTSQKDIRLTSFVTLFQMVQGWNPSHVIDVVYEDEQVLLNGEPIFLSNTLMRAEENSKAILGITS